MYIRPMTLDAVSEAAYLYRSCFAEPPWYEVFSQENVEQEMREVLSWSDTRAAVATLDDRVVGAAYGFRLWRKPDILELVQQSPECFYVSEIFVDPNVRGRGVACSLVRDLLGCQVIGSSGVVRTSVNQPIILRMFARMGWQVAVRQNVTSQKRIAGCTVEESDERIIMVGRIG